MSCRYLSIAVLLACSLVAGSEVVSAAVPEDGRDREERINLGSNRTCDRLVAENQLESDFFGLIAHATHSLNKEALAYITEQDVSDVNGVAVINPNLTSSAPILGDAPSCGVDLGFTTFALNQIDWVLTHMADAQFDMGKYTPLERMTHQLHMIEVWSQVKASYKDVEDSPPSTDFCSCVTNIVNNGVLKLLRLIALQIREPELMLDHQTIIGGHRVAWEGNIYKYSNFDGKAFYEGESNVESFQRLESQGGWQAWKRLMLSRKGHGSETVAKYLYCCNRMANDSIQSL